jgi:hypothetical protein
MILNGCPLILLYACQILYLRKWCRMQYLKHVKVPKGNMPLFFICLSQWTRLCVVYQRLKMKIYSLFVIFLANYTVKYVVHQVQHLPLAGIPQPTASFCHCVCHLCIKCSFHIHTLKLCFVQFQLCALYLFIYLLSVGTAAHVEIYTFSKIRS